MNSVLVIGLDGGTFDLLNPLMAAGVMPHLAKLVGDGCWGRLASTEPPFTAAAWSSFITGRNPGAHGIVSFTTKDRANYDVRGKGFVDASQFDYTLWEVLGNAGKKTAIINVPLSYPARPVNGVMVTGMLTPPDAVDFTHPPQFRDQLVDGYMVDVDFLRDGEVFNLTNLPPKTEMLSQIRRMGKKRTEQSVKLLGAKAWDFFMVVYTGTDRISHFFWDDLEPFIQGEESDSPHLAGLLDYFRELDAGISQLTAQAPPDTTIYLMSDHGFGSAPTKRFYVNVWLEQLGLHFPRPASGLLDLEYWRVRLGKSKTLKAAVRAIMPQSAQDSVSQQAQKASGGQDNADWSRSKAYYDPIYFHVCGVNINRVGVQREGIVTANEYEQIRDQILEAVTKVVDPSTGKRVIPEAYRREELYHGAYTDTMPDIVLVLDPLYIGAGSLAGSSLVEPHPDPLRPGEHRKDGMFVATGANVGARGELMGLDLLDMPASILYNLDIPIPHDFDGKVLRHLFTEAFQASHIPAQQHFQPSAPAQQTTPTANEQAEVERRLRGLGYLD